MNSTIYMIKSIPTKDSQFPQLLKCFEMEFGPQKSRVLVPLYPLLSLSRLPISSFGQEGCCEKILYDMGEILKNFAHLKNILCPPPPCSIHNECSLSWAQKLWLPSVPSKCEHETKKHVLIGCQTWHVLPPNIFEVWQPLKQTVAPKVSCLYAFDQRVPLIIHFSQPSCIFLS